MEINQTASQVSSYKFHFYVHDYRDDLRKSMKMARTWSSTSSAFVARTMQ